MNNSKILFTLLSIVLLSSAFAFAENAFAAAPTADDQSVETLEDTPIQIILTGSDTDGDTLTFTTTFASHGSLGTLFSTADNAVTIIYTPHPNYFGPDSFDFTVTDGNAGIDTATVTITVTPVDDAPTADDQSVETLEDTPIQIILTGSDVDGDTLTFTITGTPVANGSLDTVTGSTIVYSPRSNYSGPDSFDFTVNDGNGGIDTATVTITVTSTAPPPPPDDDSIEAILALVGIDNLRHFLDGIIESNIDDINDQDLAPTALLVLQLSACSFDPTCDDEILSEAQIIVFIERQSTLIGEDASFLSGYSTETLKSYLGTILTNTQLNIIPESYIPLFAGLFLDGLDDISGTLDSFVDEEEPPKKSGGGSNQWKTKPTFGLSHQTWIPLVDGGFTFNDVSYDITDNWHTDFPVQHVTLGELNTFEAKVYAEKKLMIQEFLFGIPQVGESQNAELGVEIWYDYDGVIEDIILVQETDIVDVSTVNVIHSKVKCQESDTNENCDSTILTMKFLEPLQDDVMAIKAVDFKKRSHITFLNEGFDISGISLNPMITLFIAGPEKYEGVIPITQTAKYSNLWISDDGREFEQNNYDSFKLINQVFERFVDTGIANTRAHSAFGEKIIQQQEIAQQTINEKYKPIESISRDDLSELIDQNKLIRAEFYSNDNSSELIINYNELSTICTALQSDYDARILMQTNYSYMADNNLFADTLLDKFPLIQLKMMIDSCEEKLDTLEYR